MEGFGKNRSLPLIAAVLLALGIGLFALHSFDVASGYDDFYEEDVSASYSDAEFFMDADGKGWLGNLTWVGVAVAAISALAFTRAQSGLQSLLITVGSLAAMAGPIWVLMNLDGADPGLGVFAAMICFGIAALIPWGFQFLNRAAPSPQPQS
jgi:hypothetical protein